MKLIFWIKYYKLIKINNPNFNLMKIFVKDLTGKTITIDVEADYYTGEMK